MRLAELGRVSRARITQIMNLNLLAPAIQEQLLLWEGGRASTVIEMQRVAREVGKVTIHLLQILKHSAIALLEPAVA